MGVKIDDRVEMKEFLRKSGMSVSDLHNWVARGLLPRSCARYNGEGPGSTYYYPAWAVGRAADIKRLRLAGVSMQKIRKILQCESVTL